MDLDKNLETGDRIFAGEEVFARVFAVRSISFHLPLQFLLVELNGLLVAHLMRPMEMTSVNKKRDRTEPILKGNSCNFFW